MSPSLLRQFRAEAVLGLVLALVGFWMVAFTQPADAQEICSPGAVRACPAPMTAADAQNVADRAVSVEFPHQDSTPKTSGQEIPASTAVPAVPGSSVTITVGESADLDGFVMFTG